MKKEKILVAMSGGVDSSAVAALLIKEGYCVGGATMRLCPGIGEDPTADAMAAAEKLGIEFHSFDMRREFRKNVIDDFIASYINGETPNPCIVCNRTMKFGAFLDRALELGYDRVATGHYAKIKKEGERYLLYKSECAEKDQTYVLWSLTQRALSHLVLPLGSLTKSEAREAALEAGLDNANKKESQDICFVPDGDYASFIERESAVTFPKGSFIDEQGNILGSHKGIIHYTVGQRRGLGLSLPAPLYVKEKNAKENTVILCPAENLFAKKLKGRDANWLAFDSLTSPIRLEAKIRYGKAQSPCTVTPISEKEITVEFDSPQRAPSPGQSVVFYDGDLLVGGAVIC